MCEVFSVISRVLTASRAPPGSPLPPPYRAGEGEGGGAGSAMEEEAAASVPLLPPSPPLPLQDAAEVQPAHGAGVDAPVQDGDAPHAPVGGDPQLPLPPPAQRAGTRRVGQRRPMQTPCEVHRAPACKSCRGHQGGAALLLPAPGGTPSTGASGGRCAAAHAIWDGRPVRPPLPRGGAVATIMGGGARRDRALRQRPQGARGARDGAMGG